MHLVATIQVRSTSEQRHALLATMHECNRVANLVSEYAFATKTFSRRTLQQMLYPTLRATSTLSSQQVILTIHKVADAYQRDTTVEHRFRSEGAIAYDPRILTIYTEREEVSIRTLDGRVTIPYTTGEHHRELLRHPSGQADLCYRRGKFLLRVTCTVPDTPAVMTEGILGVDFGIVNIAVDSDGRVYTGERREERRSYYERRRGALQRRGTRSARKKLRSLSGRQRRYQRNENHCIAKNIVDAASEGTKRSIALEELRGIRARTTVRRPQRSRQTNWSFAQLRVFITYKAERRGIPVIVVDPRNTSRMCPGCGHTDKGNRPSQAIFRCRACGYEKHADIVGALNICNRAAINSAYGVVECPVGVLQMQATTSGGGS